MFDVNYKNIEFVVNQEMLQDIIYNITKIKDKRKDFEIIRVNSLDELIGPLGG